MLAFERADHPFPERKRFGMRVVDAEDPDAFADPVAEHAGELAPQRAPVLRLEVERIDVLIFLGRILRILHGAVRAPAEPLRMFLDVWMIRRALERNVERDFQPVLARPRHEMAKILDGPELWMDRRMAAFHGTDGPRTAHVVRRGLERIVGTLAALTADGVDRRQVEHVEAHALDIGQAFFTIAERARTRCCSVPARDPPSR